MVLIKYQFEILAQPHNNHNPNIKTIITVVGLRHRRISGGGGGAPPPPSILAGYLLGQKWKIFMAKKDFYDTY